jgi:exopolyphosphatase/guanosine-5'-triphosphate,3'-diphosphate pyrophosphatase
MRVAVIDVGANTARLLVAEAGTDRLERVCDERTLIGLGAEIEKQGAISKGKLAEVAQAVATLAALAHAKHAHELQVLVTSPGRQSRNGHELEPAIAHLVGTRVRLLSADEEARLAFMGAVAGAALECDKIAVCDVGGGSAQIAVGSPEHGPAWTRSVQLGSLRLTRRHLRSDPPARRELRAARATVQQAFAELTPTPPIHQVALATGGTARALRKLVGTTLGPVELGQALAIVTERKATDVAAQFDVPSWRAFLLPAGVLILSEVQRLLREPLRVARGGLREGAALELLERYAPAT